MSIATLPQVTKLLELIIQKKTPSDRLQWLLEGGFLTDLLEANGNLNRDEFRQFLNLGKLPPDLTELEGIFIPGDVTIASLKAEGGYDFQSDYAKRYITDEYFKVTAFGPRRLRLAHFKKVMTSQQVEEVAEEMGYQVALVEDLLAVSSHPEYCNLQRQFPIVALGSSVVVRGNRYAPSLGMWGNKRRLDLGLYDGEWRDDCHFLLVGKDTPSDA